MLKPLVEVRKVREKTIKNSIDILVLTILKSQPLCGYDIIGLIHREFRVLLSPGTIYPLLWSFEREGLIEVSWEHRKKMYKLTNKGKVVVESMAREYEQVNNTLVKFMKVSST